MIVPNDFYKQFIYGQNRQFKGRISITQNGETQVYENDTIIRMRILEEVSILSESIPSNEVEITLDNSNGEFDYLNLPNYYEIIQSKLEIKVELGLVIGIDAIDWIPMGTFILSDWKNENTNKVVKMTANDYFSLLSDITFVRMGSSDPVAITEIIEDLFLQANIDLSKVKIDSSLDNLFVNDLNINNPINCRQALQYIGIAGRCVVYQDRYGIINIKPSSSILEEVIEYHSYPSNQTGFFRFPSNNTFPYRAKPSGMRFLYFEHMYEQPQLSLIKSLYELTVNVYNVSGEVIDELVFVRSDAQGSGLSVKIENPLINSTALATQIADWYFSESLNNIIYQVKWRGNPILEGTDVVRIQDSFNAEKKSKIYRQEFIYEGYLEGRTEAKGIF